MPSPTYDPTWELRPAGDLPAAALFAVALHRAVGAPSAGDVTAALTELDRAVHATPAGFVRRLREARSANLQARIATGATKADLARELDVTPARVNQLLAGNRAVVERAGRRRVREASARTSVRDELTAARADLRAQIVADREADRARRGADLLERVEAGENARTIAAELTATTGQPVTWQGVTAMLEAARKARKADGVGV